MNPPASAMDPRLLLDQSAAGASASAEGAAAGGGASAAGGGASAAVGGASAAGGRASAADCHNPACVMVRQGLQQGLQRCHSEIWLAKCERDDMALRVKQEEVWRQAAKLETEAKVDEIVDLRRELKYSKQRITWLETASADAQSEMGKCLAEPRQELASPELDELRHELQEAKTQESRLCSSLASCREQLRSSILDYDAVRVELLAARSELRSSFEVIDEMHEELHITQRAASSAWAAAASSASAAASWDSASYWLVSASKQQPNVTADEAAASADDEVARSPASALP